ncbi:hypothetical protein Bca4012_088842 [Brassica carinata]|uniref:BnaC01g23500D protein n=1 Tax=Brassica napus TaxID=3708 RepID=A0A078FPC5_BRANA|nr:BnaC01g23500D [Brassica napus]
MASEDEIQGARNFLIQQYAGHIPSVDAIESAHDKIIMQKFHERKNPKIDITKKTAVTFAVLRALTDSAEALVFPLRDWIFYLIVADSDLLDGICDPTVHQRTTRFRSHVFAHKLHSGFGYMKKKTHIFRDIASSFCDRYLFVQHK